MPPVKSRMPAPRKVDLDPLRALVTTWFLEDNLTSAQICARLLSEHDIDCNERTLQRRFREWGDKKRNRDPVLWIPPAAREAAVAAAAADAVDGEEPSEEGEEDFHDPWDVPFLELVEDCDNFPYTPSASSDYYKFHILTYLHPFGYLTSHTVSTMPWTHDFHISHDNRIVHLNPLSSSTTATGVAKHKACNRALQSIVDTAIHLDLFPILGGRHSEPYPILGTSPLLKIERFVANLFGIVQRGAHLTAYTYVPSPSADVSSPSSDSSTSTGKGDLKIYIPTRSPQNFTFPLLYDSTVAGGISATESALSCIVREAAEEASLPSSYVREHAKPTGCLSYIYVDDGRHDSIAWRSDSGMPTQEMRGLVQPNILYTYDLLLPSDGSIAPTKNSLDDEVHSFSLLSVEEVLRALLERRFKPNCALVMIDFFVRHGLITPENEKHYSEIVARVHRRMPFATYVGQEFTE